MIPPETRGRAVRARHQFYLTTPALWPAWPFLPVVRRRPGSEPELGVVFDAAGVCGLPGYGATVFRCNLFELPPTVAGVLALPREAFASADDLVAAGWRVD